MLTIYFLTNIIVLKFCIWRESHQSFSSIFKTYMSTKHVTGTSVNTKVRQDWVIVFFWWIVPFKIMIQRFIWTLTDFPEQNPKLLHFLSLICWWCHKPTRLLHGFCQWTEINVFHFAPQCISSAAYLSKLWCTGSSNTSQMNSSKCKPGRFGWISWQQTIRPAYEILLKLHVNLLYCCTH